MRIAFDIGGWISRYPTVARELAQALNRNHEVLILTDMPEDRARLLMSINGWTYEHFDRIISADYAQHGEGCKAAICATEKINVLFDDHPRIPNR